MTAPEHIGWKTPPRDGGHGALPAAANPDHHAAVTHCDLSANANRRSARASAWYVAETLLSRTGHSVLRGSYERALAASLTIRSSVQGLTDRERVVHEAWWCRGHARRAGFTAEVASAPA
jgi:hypothetical protein